MKKLLMGSIVLTTFSVAAIIFQMSCQKTAEAQTSSYTLPFATTASLGGVVVGSGLSVTSSGVLSLTSGNGNLTQLNKLIYLRQGNGIGEIWTANYDGTGQQKINITLPSGIVFGQYASAKLSPDGQKVFFLAYA